MTYAQLREENFRRQFIIVPDEYVLAALKQMNLELWSAHADESSIDDEAEDGEYFYTTVDAEYIGDMSDEEVFALGPFGVDTIEEAGRITAYCTMSAIASALEQEQPMTAVDTATTLPRYAYDEAFALLDEAVEFISRLMNEQRTKLLKRRHAAAVRAELQYGKDSVEFKKATDAVNHAGHGEYPTPQWLSDAGLAVGAIGYELGKAAHKSILDYQDVLGAIMQLERYALPYERLSRIHEIALELDRWHTRHIFEREEVVIEDFVHKYVREVVTVDPITKEEHHVYVALCDFDESNSVHMWVDEQYRNEGLYAWAVSEHIQPNTPVGDDQRLFVRFV